MLRLDRAITLGLAGPLLRARHLLFGSNHPSAIPILMYHGINSDPEPSVPGYYRLNTPPAVFRSHLRALHEGGYKTVLLRDIAKTFARGGDSAPGVSELTTQPGAKIQSHPGMANGKASSKTAVITFDDGFEDFRAVAWPILQEFGFTATMFLPTAFIGQERRMFKGRACLTWDEVRRLNDEGVEFGSHTVNHPKLWQLDNASLEQEMTDSRREIEQEIGVRVASFAHPYAFPFTDKPYVRRFKAAASRAGYQCTVTTSLGRVRPSDDAFALKRLPANGADDSALLKAKLDGAYDWLSLVQRIVKHAKGVLKSHSR